MWFRFSVFAGNADSLLLVTRALTSVNKRKDADKLVRDRLPDPNLLTVAEANVITKHVAELMGFLDFGRVFMFIHAERDRRMTQHL